MKSADYLDATDNLIEDLRPIAAGEDELYYYGTQKNNFNLILAGNPVRCYPSHYGGRVSMETNFAMVRIILPNEDIPFLNTGEADMVINYIHPLEFWRDDQRVDLEDLSRTSAPAQLLQNDPVYGEPSGAQVDKNHPTYGKIDCIYITGITQTGSFDLLWATNDDYTTWTADDIFGDVSEASSTMKWYEPVRIQVFSKVEKDDLKTAHTVTLAKYSEDDNELKPGAVYSLYQQLGENPDPATDILLRTDLTTGQDGTLTVEGLESENFYFLETTAPEGYKLDPNPVAFSLADGTLTVSSSSGNTLTPMGGETVTIDGAFMLPHSEMDGGQPWRYGWHHGVYCGRRD